MITIVIPAFNVGQYLESCLESILNQTYQNFEIILIDDGSTDNTSRICDTYSQRDTRIKVIHQSNAGVSAARMRGFQVASGEYLISVDADDWIEHNMLEKMYKLAKAEKADLVFCDYDKVYSDRKEVISNQLSDLSSIGYLKAQFYGGMWGTFWNKLIRTSLMRENKIYPIVGLQMWEDFAVTNRWVIYAHKIAYCKEVLYHYNQCNLGAVTKVISENNYLDIRKSVDAVLAEIKKVGIECQLENEIVRIKLTAKKYLLNDPYRNFRQWAKVYPETNRFASSVQITRAKNVICKTLAEGNFNKAEYLYHYYSFEQRVMKCLNKIPLLGKFVNTILNIIAGVN